MPEQPGHKWFAICWTWMVNHEPRSIRKVREEVVGGARGRVLEVGCGPGANFPHYPNAVAELIATDPDPYMLERARKRAADASRPIDIRQVPAEALPFEDSSFDTVVCTSVICNVRDPQKALSEMRRVLKPGGEYRFFEHVRYDGGIGGLWQDAIKPVWGWLGAGCRPNQDTARLIQEAGFQIQQLEKLTPSLLIDPTRPCIKGVAVRG